MTTAERGSGPEQEIRTLRAEVRRLRAALRRRTPSLVLLLRQRGFRVYKKEPAVDLFLPAKRHHDVYYELLQKYSFRLFLRDVIKLKNGFTPEAVARYATPAVTNAYLDRLLAFRLLRRTPAGFALRAQDVTSFGPTLEWYVAELFRREYGADALWGVKFRRPKVGGDYDVLAALQDGLLLYGEVKSSPPKQVYAGEVAAFLDRIEDLAPDAALFLMDTELRMKDKIVPLFEAELGRRMPTPPAVRRMERELFEIDGRIFIVNAKESIGRNIGVVLRRLSRDRACRSMGKKDQ
jgi:hypothetical protein